MTRRKAKVVHFDKKHEKSICKKKTKDKIAVCMDSGSFVSEKG